MPQTIHIPLDEAGPLVADVMLRGPGTHLPSTTVADARAVFESPRQKLLVLAEGSRYAGAVVPETVAGAADDALLGDLETGGVPTVAPGDPTARALELSESAGLNRIPVVDDAGDLVGLVCLNRTRAAFCVLP